tara:strand:+ start:5083 stop:5799 length:717 start_codon:yes stop_codon:yes gene_type:complete
MTNSKNNKKKQLILIRGLHNKLDNGNGPIDWRVCYKSLLENVIKYFDDYDIYFQTYDSADINELIKVYNPKKYINYPLNEFNKHNQGRNISKLLELVDDIEKYDSIFVTRFDILYKISLNNWAIKENYINIFFKHPDKRINDTVFLFNNKNIDEFKSAIKNNKSPNGNLHSVKFKSENVMIDKRYYSDTDYPEYFPLNDNPFYILHRKRNKKNWNAETAFNVAKEQGFIEKHKEFFIK